MSMYSSDVTIENIPLPIEGGNPTAVKVDGSAVTQPVSGTINVGNFPSSQAVTGPLTDAELRATPVPVVSSPVTSNVANISQVVLSSNTNATLLAANGSRKKIIFFAPKSTLYLKFGANASSSSFTYVVVSANTILEITTWTGQVDALSTANQTVTVTELV